MPRLKAKPEMAQIEPETWSADTAGTGPVEANALMTPAYSPALALQASLEQSWESRQDPAQITAPISGIKIPFGWTLIGMLVVCSAFWYALLQLIAHI